MIKRPILIAGMILCIISAVVVNKIPQILLNNTGFEANEDYTFSGSIYKIEEKTASIYIYVRRSLLARDNVLIVADKDKFSEDQFRLLDSCSFNCTFEEMRKARNNGNYDEETYLRSVGVFKKFMLKEYDVRYGYIINIPEWMRGVKYRLIDAIYLCAGEKYSSTAGIISAMLTGDRSGIDEETNRLFRNAGISHIIAISGLHITFIGMGIFSVLLKRIGRRWASVVSIMAVLAFCIMTGMSVSSVRALIMFTLRLGAAKAGRRFDILTALSLSALLILLQNPFYILNIGFKLSFSAIASIAIVAEPLNRLLGSSLDSYLDNDPHIQLAKISAKIPTNFKKKINGKLAYLISSFVTSLSITIVTLPIVANTYYEIPLYGVLINIFVLPLLSFILAGFMAGSIAGTISVLAGRFLIAFGIYIMSFIEAVCRLFEYLPFNTVVTGHISGGRMLLYYGVLAAGTIWIHVAVRNRKNGKLKSMIADRKLNIKKILILPTVIAVLLFILLYKGKNDDLKLLLFDVDQGSCAVVVTPDDNVYMFDCGSTGTSDVYKYRMDTALKYEGISKIDRIFISHPDTDHISGVMELLTGNYNMEVGCIYMPDVSDNENADILRSAAENAGIQVLALDDSFESGTSDENDYENDLFNLKCLHPSTSYVSSDVNGYSAVMSLEYVGVGTLICGDLLLDGEQILLEQNIKEHEILVVPHHGSKNSNSNEFLAAVSPKLSLISAGVDNFYGHPHAETLESLKTVGSYIFSTKAYGEIIVNIDRKGRIIVNTILEE